MWVNNVAFLPDEQCTWVLCQGACVPKDGGKTAREWQLWSRDLVLPGADVWIPKRMSLPTWNGKSKARSVLWDAGVGPKKPGGGRWKRGHRAIERGCQKRRWQWFTCQKEASFHIAHPGGLVEMDLHSRGVPASAHWVIMVFSGWSLVLCMRGNLEGVVAISSDRQTWMYIYWALSAGISKHWTLMQHSDYGATI